MVVNKFGKYLIWVVSIISIVGMFFLDPIQQDLVYHITADKREMLGIPNFWNVVSNIPFLIVGILGLVKFNRLKLIPEMGVAYWLLFFGVAMVAFGSGYYHLNPNNSTLVWDRLPMTIAFMSLFSIIISEFVDIRKGALLLLPLIVIGILSVVYWQMYDDLRFYALVQFLPIVLIPIILVFYQASFVNNTGYWLVLLAYIAAKILEYFDAQVFALLGGIISGHSLKHISAAIGIFLLFLCYKNRLRVYSLEG